MELILQIIVGRAVKGLPPHRRDETRSFSRMAVGAGARLAHQFDPLGIGLIDLGVKMAALFIVIFAKGVAGLASSLLYTVDPQ